MAADFYSSKKLTAIQQHLDFKQNLACWQIQSKPNGFKAKAVIQPTPLSDCYTVRVTYRQDCSPVIKVLNNQLKPRYLNGKLSTPM